MKCPRCRHENPPQAKFCEECATPAGSDLLELRDGPFSHRQVLPLLRSSRCGWSGHTVS
jgi:hypothetical protein